MASKPDSLLPADIMELQLSTIDLLISMFPSPGELEVPQSTTECMEKLRNWCESPNSAPSGILSSILLGVHLPIDDGEKSIQVNISIPLQCQDLEIDQPPPLSYSLRQPDWLSRAEVARLTAAMPSDDVFETFNYIQTEAIRFIEARPSSTPESKTSQRGPIVRVWFYFPSLSTREKRDDIVNYAPGYGLTGFVLAGKPGLLCLEGDSGDIDAYMRFIKTHSWGDIPSHQKKVSERYRETGAIERAFTDMSEITDSLGERGGQRANRGDMQALEAWLNDRGLQEAFEKVIF
ncbi:hypothetical protein FE257_009201 [Aspergillus nanangensis]|uniref:Small nuclear ribonucleoprotein Prp3 C-terminal domain-containing protein n=1 Tax=Aspergillus nanangensis TaxID=2582783 RepID=A0AAD4GT30_ASPNN|nr:hypothetical protein FE257_009201 [Aspergillus nanangensis]